MAEWARHARRLPSQLLVGAGSAVAALCLVCLVGEGARGAERAHAAGTCSGLGLGLGLGLGSGLGLRVGLGLGLELGSAPALPARQTVLGGATAEVLSWQPPELSHANLSRGAVSVCSRLLMLCAPEKLKVLPPPTTSSAVEPSTFTIGEESAKLLSRKITWVGFGVGGWGWGWGWG